MAYLLDTGILLRLANKQEKHYSAIRTAIGSLIRRRERLVIATQNAAEFGNVVTRPVANNGFGRSPAEAVETLEREIEPICTILGETESSYVHLKRLVAAYNVSGKQVHDARLVALMLACQIENILTLNDRDFRRYEPEGIGVVTPDSLAKAR
jgi:predicted nucleic acid-binding protein